MQSHVIMLVMLKRTDCIDTVLVIVSQSLLNEHLSRLV